MNIITPFFDKKQNPAGVYKITFDKKWFYIGSSEKLRSRFRSWKANLLGRKFLKSINIRQILDGVSEVEFHIIRIYANKKLIRGAETRLIKKNWDNPLLLNRCPDGSTNLGIRPYNGQKRKKDIPRLPLGFNRKPVAQFDKNKNFVMVHKSISDAAKFLKCKPDPIRLVISGRRGHYKGNFFKQVSPDGSFIEPPVFVNKRLFGTPILQLTKNGNLVAKHISLAAALRAVNGDRRNMQRALNGEYRYKTVKGYVFKYE